MKKDMLTVPGLWTETEEDTTTQGTGLKNNVTWMKASRNVKLCEHLENTCTRDTRLLLNLTNATPRPGNTHHDTKAAGDCDADGYKQERYHKTSSEMKRVLVKVGWKKMR